MQICTTDRDMIRALKTARTAGKTIGLVPTMGCLHAGHHALIHEARKHADIVVASIYVNPLQFGQNEDFGEYPRTFEQDVSICEKHQVDIVYAPTSVYSDNAPDFAIATGEPGSILCGAHRPGHFDGVATVVSILFNLIRPNIAVFGEKDYQQLTIIQHMARFFKIPTKILGTPTVREDSGLAMSSRNRYLSEVEQNQAMQIYQSLQMMRDAVRNGQHDVNALQSRAMDYLKTHNITPEYLEVRHARTLAEIHTLDNAPARALIAVRIGKTRLIDNIALERS